MRKIIHIDMDAFYASVEQLDNPEYRNKPLVVGGLPGSRGVICAASYEARKYGVRSAMPSSTAAKLCDHLIFVKPHFARYKEISKTIRDIFLSYSELVEPLSLDEAYLDVTSNKKNMVSATLIANEIRHEIFKNTGLTASAGVSINKFLAKVASDINKPNGITVIRPDQVHSFLSNLPIERFYGVGTATTTKMHQVGIHTGNDLMSWDRPALVKHFGKMGSFYFDIVRGIDDRPVSPKRNRKSIGAERTFKKDISGINHLEHELSEISLIVAKRLEQAKSLGKTITLKVRNSDFQTITRQMTSHNYMKDQLFINEMALTLLKQSARFSNIRLLGVSISNLIPESATYYQQLILPFHPGTISQ